MVLDEVLGRGVKQVESMNWTLVGLTSWVLGLG